MNIPFLNPTEYLNQHPSLLISSLPPLTHDLHTITSLKFSQCGLYLAIGRLDGRIFLMDVESRGILSSFSNGHDLYCESGLGVYDDYTTAHDDSLQHTATKQRNTEKLPKECVVSDFIWLRDQEGTLAAKFANSNPAATDLPTTTNVTTCSPCLHTGKWLLNDSPQFHKQQSPHTNSLLHKKPHRFLLSCAYASSIPIGSTKGQLFLWDILNHNNSDPIHEYQFDHGLITIDSNPQDETTLLVSLFDSQSPLIVNLLTDERMKLPLRVKKQDYVVARYDPTGEKIYCGNASGELTILDADSLQILKQFDVESGNCIFDIQFTARGKYYLVNADGTVKVYHAATDSFQYNVKNSDMETRQHYWCGFSGLGPIVSSDTDSSFVYGACKSTLYIWSRSQGFEVAALNPLKQRNTTILRIAWHPRKPLLICSGNDGYLYFYTIPIRDNWSAFAPGFEEIELNDEYVEREDEYDDELVEEEKRRQEKDLDVLDDMRERIDILSLKEANEQSILEWYVPLKIEQDDWLNVLERKNQELMDSRR